MSDEDPILTCPHCSGAILIKKINCGIFRHGIFKKNSKQIDPHAPKKVCDKYIKKNLINGCGKPFKVVLVDELIKTEICDYI